MQNNQNYNYGPNNGNNNYQANNQNYGNNGPHNGQNYPKQNGGNIDVKQNIVNWILFGLTAIFFFIPLSPEIFGISISMVKLGGAYWILLILALLSIGITFIPGMNEKLMVTIHLIASAINLGMFLPSFGRVSFMGFIFFVILILTLLWNTARSFGLGSNISNKIMNVTESVGNSVKNIGNDNRQNKYDNNYDNNYRQNQNNQNSYNGYKDYRQADNYPNNQDLYNNNRDNFYRNEANNQDNTEVKPAESNFNNESNRQQGQHDMPGQKPEDVVDSNYTYDPNRHSNDN